MTTIGLGDFVTALRMRDLIKKLVSEEIEAQRPKVQYATVVTIDRAARKCMVQYPDDIGTVKVSMGSIQPSREGQVVRIDGPLGDRFISDVMGTVFTDSINASHPAVRAATVAPVTLAGTQTVDGVALVVGDRVLVKNQASWPENGIYDVKSGGWTRAADADQATDVAAGSTWFVLEGTDHARRSFMQIQPVATIGVSGLEFVEPNLVEHVGPFSYPGPVRKGHILYDAWNKSIVTWNGFSWEPASNIHICTSTTRPTFILEGHMIYETDTKRFAIMTAGSWIYEEGYPDVIDLGTAEDLNSLEQTGLWNQNAIADADVIRNYPEKNAGLLEVFRAIPSGGMIHQRFSTYNSSSGRVWWRTRYNGVWNPWVLIGGTYRFVPVSGNFTSPFGLRIGADFSPLIELQGNFLTINMQLTTSAGFSSGATIFATGILPEWAIPSKTRTIMVAGAGTGNTANVGNVELSPTGTLKIYDISPSAGLSSLKILGTIPIK